MYGHLVEVAVQSTLYSSSSEHTSRIMFFAWRITTGQPNATVSSTGTPSLIVPLMMSQGILDVVVIGKWQSLATKLNFSLMQLSVMTVYTKYGLS